jgi:hypothetical protein
MKIQKRLVLAGIFTVFALAFTTCNESTTPPTLPNIAVNTYAMQTVYTTGENFDPHG